MPFVNPPRDIRVAPCAEDRRRTSIRVHPRKVVRGQREAPLRVFDGVKIVKEERALGLVEPPLLASKDENTELERPVNVL